MKKISLYIITALSALLLFNSCADEDYAEPIFTEPIFEGVANKSISQLKELYTNTSSTSENTFNGVKFVTIDQDLIIEGYVVSTDEFGNFYKNLVIQGSTDGTSEGIMLQLGENSLYTKYPIGQKVFVKCKDLVLGKYGEQIQLGAGHYWYKNKEFRLAPIASPSIDYHLFKDKKPVHIDPKPMNIADLTDANLFTLITIEGVQFDTEANQTWGNIDGDHTAVFPFKETKIVDAVGDELPVFTSDYSKFAYKYTPKGSGSITGILSKHKDKIQFIVNNIEDVEMDDPRFKVVPKPIEGEEDVTYDFRLNFTDQTDNTNFVMADWVNYSEKGSHKWFVQKDKNSENRYASCSNYNTGDEEMISWLVTPKIDATTQKYFALFTGQHHWAHDATESPIEIFYSEDFDGTEVGVGTATWLPLSVSDIANKSTSDWDLINSEQVALPLKNIYIAVKYSATKIKTTGYLVDEIRVFKKN